MKAKSIVSVSRSIALQIACLLAALFLTGWPLTEAAEDARFEGKFFRGRGDLEYLQLLDTARRMFEPDPEFQNLSMLYMPAWNGLVEGPTWDAWWIQNSYGTTYSALPFYREPFVTFLQNSQDLWFDQMGDGRRIGAPPPFNWVAPDGALCDAARPGWVVYKQGDGRTSIHDWGMEFTAAGIVLQTELLLISRDQQAIAKYLPKLERSANFIETRRDPTNHLFLAGPAGNLLAPSYAGWKKPDGTYGQAYLAGLSVTYIAALDRLIELEKLAGRPEKVKLYSQRRDEAKKGLAQLATDESYFIRSLDPDGVKHGVFGAARHGYFEASPNHDAIAFRVVDDAQAERIYQKMAGIPGLRPHHFILPNYPSYDDMYEKPEGLWTFGTWVNGGHWSTCEARMILGYYRLGKFEDARRSMRQLLTFADKFRMDNPLVKFGSAVYQPNQPINLTYDALGPPAAFVRGLFEYLYRADALTLIPHIPENLMELEQNFPIRFGQKQLFLSVTGRGDITGAQINGRSWTEHDAKSVSLAYDKTPEIAKIQIFRGGAKPRMSATTGPERTATPKPAAAPQDLAALERRAARLRRFLERLKADGLDGSYEATHAQLALDSITTMYARRHLLSEGKLKRLPEPSQSAADKSYLETATKLFDGLEQVLSTDNGSNPTLRRKAREFWREAQEPHEAARGLLERLLPKHAGYFVLEAMPKDLGGDVFEIESRDGRIVLRGNNGVAIASALNWYLKHYCHAHVSWCGDQLNLPEPLPALREKVRQVSPFQYRYCFNYCAFSYSLAWWDWAQWERMIDWMALHGINMPLSVTGQEAVWQEVYRKLGLSDRQIKEFFVGPAFLPFGWMGCLDGWGGPLPDSWIQKRAELERRILARERAFGMTPVLQGFTGHVPPGLTNLFPQAKLQRLPSWCRFPPTHFVDPQDPLFVQLGKLFIEEQTRLFGTDHLYASDTFIEMRPPSNDPQFLSGMSKAIYEAMRAGDPKAVWVLQGWIFVNEPKFWQPPQGRALFGAVPDDRLIALDLYCEDTPVWSKTEAFYGKPWIWCVLQNFGGAVSLHGALPRMADDLAKALTSPQRGKLSGLGLIFEGLDYNPIVQDFVTDMTWRSQVPHLEDWSKEFVHRRYGQLLPEAQEAWRLLRETAYRQVGRNDTVLCLRPGSGRSGSAGPYDPEILVQAAEKLLSNEDALGQMDTYQFDLVNLVRHILGTAGQVRHAQLAAAIHKKDPAALDQAGRDLLQIITDLDDLLATRKEFLLGRWLEDAKRWATNDDERRLYEWNARNLITLWGPRDSLLHEYALRQWSGMFKGFYGRRWGMFVDRQRAALKENKPFDTAQFEADLRAWEEEWTHQTESYPTEPRGAAVSLARKLVAKYKPLLQ